MNGIEKIIIILVSQLLKSFSSKKSKSNNGRLYSYGLHVGVYKITLEFIFASGKNFL